MDDEEPNNSKENKDLGQSKVSDRTGWKFYIYVGPVVVLIAWYLDLQLPMQSVSKKRSPLRHSLCSFAFAFHHNIQT